MSGRYELVAYLAVVAADLETKYLKSKVEVAIKLTDRNR